MEIYNHCLLCRTSPVLRHHARNPRIWASFCRTDHKKKLESWIFRFFSGWVGRAGDQQQQQASVVNRPPTNHAQGFHNPFGPPSL